LGHRHQNHLSVKPRKYYSAWHKSDIYCPVLAWTLSRDAYCKPNASIENILLNTQQNNSRSVCDAKRIPSLAKNLEQISVNIYMMILSPWPKYSPSVLECTYQIKLSNIYSQMHPLRMFVMPRLILSDMTSAFVV